MNTAQEARLDAQARQMAFEMGYAPAPTAAAATAAPARPVAHPVTEKQVAFIKRLVGERQLSPSLSANVADARVKVMAGRLSSKDASALIDALLLAPKWAEPETAAAAPATEPEDGIYVDTDDEGSRVFKVYKMVHGSGRQGVKRLVVDEHGSGRFEYVGLAAKHLPTAARRMTLEEAAAFGRLYGVCVRCGRTLTDEGSIAAGIGPICADKM